MPIIPPSSNLRKESRTIKLTNPTMLPAKWKLSGIDELNKSLALYQTAGIIDAQSTYSLNAYFRPLKLVKLAAKRGLRLEVFDIDNLVGLLQVENIQINAEAFDVPVDIHFSKGQLAKTLIETVIPFNTSTKFEAYNLIPYQGRSGLLCINKSILNKSILKL